MSSDKTNYNIIFNTLTSVFSSPDWTPTHYEIYKIIKNFYNDFKEKCRIYETRDDKIIIRNNIKEQPWFTFSKSKPIISQLLDNMTLVNYIHETSENCIIFNVVLSFGKFHLQGHLYKDMSEGKVSSYILVKNEKKKAYFTSYNQSNTQQNKLPDFDEIYEIIGLSQNMLYQCDLLNLIGEIIMFYDESQNIGNIPISNAINVNLNQLIEKFNSYILNKKQHSDFKIL